MAVEGPESVDTPIPTHAQNVLFEAPAATAETGPVCYDLVTNGNPASTRVLTLSYRDTASEIVEGWRESVGQLPAELVVIEARQHGSNPDDLPEEVTVLTEDPGDLTWFGVHTSEHLTRWHDAPEDIGICIDSLTSMLQYAELEKVYRFLHIFTGRVETVNGRAHHHLDPRAHERQEIHTIKQLCDAVLSYDEDAENWAVTTR